MHSSVFKIRIPWVTLLQGGWSCGNSTGSSSQEISCLLLPLRHGKIDSKSQTIPYGVQLKFWRLRSLFYGPRHQELQITDLIDHFVSKGQLKKHLEFYYYFKTILSEFCFDPDIVNFFSIVGFDISPTLEIGFI